MYIYIYMYKTALYLFISIYLSLKHWNMLCVISNTKYPELFSRSRFLLSVEIRTLTILFRRSIARIECRLCCRTNALKKSKEKRILKEKEKGRRRLVSLRQREPTADRIENVGENMRRRWGIRPARSSLGSTRGLPAIYHGIITESIADSRSLFFPLP